MASSSAFGSAMSDEIDPNALADKAGEEYVGYHEHLCGDGRIEGAFRDGFMAGWRECMRQFLGDMETTNRDPLLDPQVGDKIFKITSSGLRQTRHVVKRVGNDIFYLDHRGKEKKCWISTWMEWGRTAEVEPA